MWWEYVPVFWLVMEFRLVPAYFSLALTEISALKSFENRARTDFGSLFTGGIEISLCPRQGMVADEIERWLW